MATQRTVKLIAKLQDNVSPGLRNLARGATMAAGAITAVGIAAFAAAKKMGEYGASIYDTAAATGISIEDTQALGYAFEQTGGSASSMGGSIRGLNTFMRTAATGGAEYMKVLDDLGLEYDQLRAMTPTDAFLSLTDAIGKLDNEMERNLAATTVFGGRYAQQIVGSLEQAEGSLRNLTEAFEESGRAMSTDQISALKAYDDAMTDLDYGLKKIMADAIMPLLPLLTDTADKFEVLAKDIMPSLIPMIESAIQIMSDNLPRVVRLLGTAADGWERINDAVRDGGPGMTQAQILQDALAAAVTAGAISVEEATAEWEQYTRTGRSTIQTIEGMVNPVAMAVNAVDDLTASHGLLRDQQITVSAEFDNTARAAFAAAAAIDSVTASSRTATPAAVGQATAMMGLAIAYQNIAIAAGTGEGSTEGIASGLRAGIDPLGKIEESTKDVLFNLKESVKALRDAKDEMGKTGELLDEFQAKQELQRQYDERTAAARQQAIDNAKLALADFGASMVMAAAQGEEAWGQFWNSFRQQLYSLIASSAFQTLLGVFSGGIGGIFGSLFGFTAGTPSVPLGGTSGLTIPGSPGEQGDKRIIKAQAGEELLSKRQVNDLRKSGGGGTYHVQLSFPSTIGTASRADMARAVPVLRQLLEKGGMI